MQTHNPRIQPTFWRSRCKKISSMPSALIASAIRAHIATWLSVLSYVLIVLEITRKSSQCFRATLNHSSRKRGIISNWEWYKLEETRSSSSFSESMVKKENQSPRNILPQLLFTTGRSSASKRKISNLKNHLLPKMLKNSPSVLWSLHQIGQKVLMKNMQSKIKQMNWLKRPRKESLLYGGRLRMQIKIKEMEAMLVVRIEDNRNKFW